MSGTLESRMRLTLDVTTTICQATITATQGETGRRYNITLADNGRVLNLPVGTHGYLIARRIIDGENEPFTENLVIDHVRGEILLALTNENSVAVAGNFDCQLMLMDESGGILFSPRIGLAVRPSLYDEKIEKSKSFDAFKSSLNAFKTTKDEVIRDSMELKQINEQMSVENRTITEQNETIIRQNASIAEMSRELVEIAENHRKNVENPHSVTADQIGLGNLTNDAQVKRSEMGVAGGVPVLDENEYVQSSNLPSIIDYQMMSDFPEEGNLRFLYIDQVEKRLYKYIGNGEYQDITPTCVNLYNNRAAFPRYGKEDQLYVDKGNHAIYYWKRAKEGEIEGTYYPCTNVSSGAGITSIANLIFEGGANVTYDGKTPLRVKIPEASDETPKRTINASGSPGSSEDYSRADHEHPTPIDMMSVTAFGKFREDDFDRHVQDKQNPHSGVLVPLDPITGLVPNALLPPIYVDVQPYASIGSFPLQGDPLVVYQDQSNGKEYYWDQVGKRYVERDHLRIGDTAGTAFDGARGKMLENMLNGGNGKPGLSERVADAERYAEEAAEDAAASANSAEQAAQEAERAAASVPTIGENGNWWIGDEDTGVSAGGSAKEDITIVSDLRGMTNASKRYAMLDPVSGKHMVWKYAGTTDDYIKVDSVSEMTGTTATYVIFDAANNIYDVYRYVNGNPQGYATGVTLPENSAVNYDSSDSAKHFGLSENGRLILWQHAYDIVAENDLATADQSKQYGVLNADTGKITLREYREGGTSQYPIVDSIDEMTDTSLTYQMGNKLYTASQQTVSTPNFANVKDRCTIQINKSWNGNTWQLQDNNGTFGILISPELCSEINWDLGDGEHVVFRTNFGYVYGSVTGGSSYVTGSSYRKDENGHYYINLDTKQDFTTQIASYDWYVNSQFKVNGIKLTLQSERGALDESDLQDLIITINQPITYTQSSEWVWSATEDAPAPPEASGWYETEPVVEITSEWVSTGEDITSEYKDSGDTTTLGWEKTSEVAGGDDAIIRETVAEYLAENAGLTGNVLAGKKCVCFGDSITNKGGNTAISNLLADMSGMTVYNQGYDGARMSTRSGDDSEGVENAMGAFSFFRLADAVATGDFSAQDAAIATVNASSNADYKANVMPAYQSRLTVLRNLDFYTIDIVTVAYGFNDFSSGKDIADTGTKDNEATETFCGALKYGLRKLLTAYPHLRILVITPIFGNIGQSGAVSGMDSDNRNPHGNAKILPKYVEAIKDAATDAKVPCLDAYYNLGINRFNWQLYYSNGDTIHPLETGRRRYAELLHGALSGLF